MPCLAESNIVHRDEDPNARNGMMTKVWGPAGWLFLHCVTFGYPIDPDQYDQENGLPPGHTRRHYAHFFNEVGRVLPCRYCRDSYLEYIRDLPVERHLYNRDSLVKWLSVYKELIDMGVAKNRLTFKGHGNKLPIYKNPISNEQSSANRRVEITIKELN